VQQQQKKPKQQQIQNPTKTNVAFDAKKKLETV